MQNRIIYIALLALIPIIGIASAVDFTITRQAGDTSNALLIENNAGLDQFWVDSDGFAFHNGTQIELSIHNIQNVTSTGCATNEILKASGGSWNCAADAGGSSFDDNVKLFFGTDDDTELYYDGADFIIDPDAVGGGDLKVDAQQLILGKTGSTQRLVMDRPEILGDGTNIGSFRATAHNAASASKNYAQIFFTMEEDTAGGEDGSLKLSVLKGGSTTDYIKINDANSDLVEITRDLNVLNGQHTFNSTFYDIDTNQIAGSMTCTNGQILEYNSATDVWDCGTDDTGGGGSLTGEGILERLALWNSTTSLNSTANLTYDFGNSELNINTGQHTFNSTFYDIDTNQIAGSMGCSDTQSLAFNSTSNIWECSSGGGGGSDFTDRGRCVLEVPEGTVAYPDIHVLATASAKISGFVMPDGASASTINFKCDVPDNLASTPAASIKVYIMTLGTVAGPADVRLTISTLAVADTENVDVALTAESETTVTMPTATETLDVYDQDLTSDPTAGEIMTGQLGRNPAHADDDFTDDIMIIAIYFEVDRTSV